MGIRKQHECRSVRNQVLLATERTGMTADEHIDDLLAENRRLHKEVATARNLASLSCDLIEEWKRKHAESEAKLWVIKSRWT